ncbi:hypothetical protein ULMS_24810 [Patiriisocius marinistellae]|uniref:Phasin domain-containing protein n=1 Tax=Patiriisocius marinistellae TaxID=2494560 RepID=A0A5J4FY50_9FLAO|nr:hypothetical protein [Patiriisocius marinistellae]GEQ86973.1 hypothetical protein ULMS_24810 [Patiriisocius marinistellae]
MKKKVNVKNAKGMISKAMNTSKTAVTKANDFALNTTEVVVTGSLEATAQWQTVADNAIKGGLKLAKNQQDLVFDVLNEIKSQVKESKKRFSKLVA